MKFHIKPTDPKNASVDVLILFCEEKNIRSSVGLLSKELITQAEEGIQKEGFSGKQGECLIISTRGNIQSYKLLLCGGVEEREEKDAYTVKRIVADAIKKSQEMHPFSIAIVVPSSWLLKFSTKLCIEYIVEACRYASYSFTAYKNEEEKQKRQIEHVYIHLPAGKIASGEEGINQGISIADATCFVRDLVNEPSSVTTPSFLAETAENLSKTSKKMIHVDVLEKEDIKKLNMNAFLGVSQGSDELPKFIRLAYKPSRPKKKVVLIGKGITFDTGGLSLKSPEHMETMKLDMAGAATILGIFHALPYLQPRVEVIGLIAACENMPSGKAIKPGDIVKAMSGKTIEILNTDAEGRLTLADTICYANIKEKPDEIIDVATLTGACMVALGQDIAGLWGNREELLRVLEKSAFLAGEQVWRMPLEEHYKKLIKSHVADIKNIQTGKYGGAITAALFLSEFANSTAWAHLDIAGPAFEEKDSSLTPYGGTGFGVGLLLHYLISL